MYFGHLQHRPTVRRSGHQSGYMLIVVVFVMVGMMIAALAMAPAIAMQIKRDREQELIHRGAQYARAVKKYYKKFGRYPPTLEALEDTNHLRFLRKRYKDPLTQDGKWQLVRFGQVQMNATQRQGGTGGTGFSAGGTGLPNVPGVTSMLTGQSPQTTSGQPMGSTLPGGAGSTTGSLGTTASSTDTTGSTGSSFGQSNTGGGNQQFGGGAIIGVSSMSDKESLRVVDDKNHYKDWKFIYDPTFDRVSSATVIGPLINGPYDPKKQMGQIGGQQPGQQLGQPIGQQPTTGFGNPSTGFGNNPGGNTFGQPNQSPAPQPYQPPDQNAPPPNPQ
jgi:type II secretory pathway pseudopilin PulG